jgi:broad specificity phosphatase PhoE
VKLILVRHGQTNQNVTDDNGNAGNNYPLNKEGLEQAKKTGVLINKMHPTIVYTSPRERAQQTASIIASACNITDVNITDTLLEYDMGDWSSLSSLELESRVVNDANWINGRPSFDWKPPGGDSWQDLQNRAELFLEELKNLYKNSDVIVAVSHNQFIRCVRGVALGLDFEDWFAYRPKNAEFIELEI